MNKYQEAIAIRNAYIQTESGTKCLDDYYKEKFDTLQELIDNVEFLKKFLSLEMFSLINSFGKQNYLKVLNSIISLNNDDYLRLKELLNE